MSFNKEELITLDKTHVWHHLTQHKDFKPTIYVKGEGMHITNIN